MILLIFLKILNLKFKKKAFDVYKQTMIDGAKSYKNISENVKDMISGYLSDFGCPSCSGSNYKGEVFSIIDKYINDICPTDECSKYADYFNYRFLNPVFNIVTAVFFDVAGGFSGKLNIETS